jgi:hypothetical protein
VTPRREAALAPTHCSPHLDSRCRANALQTCTHPRFATLTDPAHTAPSPRFPPCLPSTTVFSPPPTPLADPLPPHQVRVKQQTSRPTKLGSIEGVVNRNLVFLVGLLLLNCTAGAIGDAAFVSDFKGDAWYLDVRVGGMGGGLTPLVCIWRKRGL